MRRLALVVVDYLTRCWFGHQGEYETSETELYLRCITCGVRSEGVPLTPRPIATSATKRAPAIILRFERSA